MTDRELRHERIQKEIAECKKLKPYGKKMRASSDGEYVHLKDYQKLQFAYEVEVADLKKITSINLMEDHYADAIKNLIKAVKRYIPGFIYHPEGNIVAMNADKEGEWVHFHEVEPIFNLLLLVAEQAEMTATEKLIGQVSVELTKMRRGSSIL